MKNTFFASLIFFTCGLYAVDSTMQIRHRDPGGVGYSQGYTTVDYLLSTEGDTAEFLLNLRGHIFNDAQAAGNGGLGVRFPLLDCNYRLGVNAFYDFRESSDLFAHQIGTGLEWLGETFDIRMNGYIAYGSKSHTERREFKQFYKHRVLITRHGKDSLSAMDAEVGIPLPNWCYFAAGPYYLFQERKHGMEYGKAWGAKVRGEMTIVRYLTLGFAVSYDHIFHTRAQGIIALNIPIGKWNKRSEQEVRVFSQVPIMRSEIIPIQDKRKKKAPLTYFIVDEKKEKHHKTHFTKPEPQPPTPKTEKKPTLKKEKEKKKPTETPEPEKKPKKIKEKEIQPFKNEEPEKISPKEEKEDIKPIENTKPSETPKPKPSKVKKIKYKKLKKKEIEAKEEEPVNFIFVENTADKKNADGSFEKPYASLKEAEHASKPGDVIYVFPGDGTAKNMNEGIVLKDEQIIASSGSPLYIENVTIPVQTPGEKPSITNIHDDQPVIGNPGNSVLDDFIFVPPWEYLFGNWTETPPIISNEEHFHDARQEGFEVINPVESEDNAENDWVVVSAPHNDPAENWEMVPNNPPSASGPQYFIEDYQPNQ